MPTAANHHSKTSWIRKLAVALIGAAALASVSTSCMAVAISKLVVFGDSTVDSGYYRALANPGGGATYNAQWASAVANGAGVPTSSPGQMFSEVLAARLGLSALPSNQTGGTNYATSGAKNADVNTAANGGFQAAIPTVTQIANYLAANGNRADPNALYLISSGSNDVVFAAGQSGTGPYPADPTAYLTSRANSLATAVASLMTAGGTRFVVANLTSSFPSNNAGVRQLKDTYNQALFTGLGNQRVPVVVADINAVRVAIQNSPASYGFSSTSNVAGQTACTAPPGITSGWALLCSSNPGAPSTFTSSNADMTSLFADDQHLATAGQRILGNYVYDLVLQNIATGLQTTDIISGVWWNPAESGWGVNLIQQGNVMFATLFIYDQMGQPLWLVMSNGVRQVGGNDFIGDLYQTTGSAFNASPFTPIKSSNITKMGTMSVAFTSTGYATLTYNLNTISVTKLIQPQVFGSRPAQCAQTLSGRSGLSNYQDLWWNPAESGWGVNVTHQDNTLFATLFTYDASGAPMWLVMSNGARQSSDGSYLGDLYRTNGTPYYSSPFNPVSGSNITKVGTMRFLFKDGASGTLTYSVNGVSVTKTISRQEFSSPLAACGS
ncbi:hypothetical protein BH11PSE11_BH11PSE11_30970 [soil metagenome]